MARSVYIETTVVSYLVAPRSTNPVVSAHQEVTLKLWPLLSSRYETYVSALVIEEAGRGRSDQSQRRLEALRPFPVLEIDEESKEVARALTAGRAIPEAYPEDALHVAVAAVNGIDALVTWNFGHLNNPFTRMMIRQIVEGASYICPEICSPDELLGDET